MSSGIPITLTQCTKRRPEAEARQVINTRSPAGGYWIASVGHTCQPSPTEWGYRPAKLRVSHCIPQRLGVNHCQIFVSICTELVHFCTGTSLAHVNFATASWSLESRGSSTHQSQHQKTRHCLLKGQMKMPSVFAMYCADPRRSLGRLRGRLLRRRARSAMNRQGKHGRHLNSPC